MAALIISPEARADLKAIGDWIAHGNPERAETFVIELEQTCSDLTTFPLAYPSFSQLGPNTHRRNHGVYAILYDVQGDEVIILRVVHGRRDLDSLFT